MKNYYQILGVSETASDDEIRSAYRRLLQESLMDKERFDAVKQAFEALRTPDRRAAYDQSLLRADREESPSPGRKTGTARLNPSGLEPEKPAAPGYQGAGLRVGQIIQLADHLPDALGHFGIDGGDVIDGARDGGDRDIGELRNSMNIHVRWIPRGAALGFGSSVCHGHRLECVYSILQRMTT